MRGHCGLTQMSGQALHPLLHLHRRRKSFDGRRATRQRCWAALAYAGPLIADLSGAKIDFLLCSQDAKRFQPTTLSVSNLQNTGCSVGSVTRHHRLCAKSKRVQHHKHKLRKRFTSKLTVNRATTSEVDVVVIGGGIIGLCVAFQLLCHSSKPSVALVERQVPCSGATGAGLCAFHLD